jgi:hypothetical protein
VAQSHGVNFEVQDKIPPEDGRDMVRRFLRECVFDREGTKEGRMALMSHRSEYDGRNQTLRIIAKHDWTSHYADSFRTGCQAGRDPDLDIRDSMKNWQELYSSEIGGFAA